MKIYQLRAEDTQAFNSSSVQSQNFLFLRRKIKTWWGIKRTEVLVKQ